MNERAKIQFAAWLKQTYPTLYKRAATAADKALAARTEAMEKVTIKKANGKTLSGLGQAETEAKKSWFGNFLDSAVSLGSAYLSLKNQQDQLQINAQRAAQGLPPIDIAGAPVLRTQVELPPETVDKITAGAGLQVNKILLFAGIGIAAYMLLK